jgi:hypothetical protein
MYQRVVIEIDTLLVGHDRESESDGSVRSFNGCGGGWEREQTG